jgi:hypothetical protein
MDALEALALLRRELDKTNSETVPDGWRTARQWAEAWGLQRAHTTALIRAGIEAGRVEMREFKVSSAAGIRRMPHYRVKP